MGCSVGVKHSLKCFAGTVPFFIIYKIGIRIWTNSIAMQLLQILASGILYFVILFLLKDEIVIAIVHKIIKIVKLGGKKHA